MQSNFFTVALFAYFVSTFLFWLYLAMRKESIFTGALTAVSIAFVCHTAYIVIRYIETQHLPVSNSYESMAALSWVVILSYLITEYRYKIYALGPFIVPLGFIGMVYAALLPEEGVTTIPALTSLWFRIHITLAFLGIAAFALNFCVGIMYLIQERQLKLKRLGTLYYRLPSLDKLDSVGRHSLYFGFPLLTLGAITASIWAEFAKGAFWNWELKRTVVFMVTWFIYAVLFFGRITVGWRGKRAAGLSVMGFLIVLLGYLIHLR